LDRLRMLAAFRTKVLDRETRAHLPVRLFCVDEKSMLRFALLSNESTSRRAPVFKWLHLWQLAVEDSTAPGEVWIDPDVLRRFVKALPGELVTLSADAPKLTVTGDGVEFTMGCVDPDEHGLSPRRGPEPVPAEFFELPDVSWHRVLMLANDAMATDLARFGLDQVSIEHYPKTGGVRFIATDGHRLWMQPHGKVGKNVPKKLLGIRSTIVQCLRSARPKKMRIWACHGPKKTSQMRIRGHGFDLAVGFSINECEFPDWRPVLPGWSAKKYRPTSSLTFDRGAMKTVCERALLVANYGVTKVEVVDGRLVIERTTKNAGYRESIDCQVEGEPPAFGCTIRLLHDLLKRLPTGEVKLQQGDSALSPIVCDCADGTYILMPARLD
jgi:DNA polymerase III sliding clamp (beta) subunit (PCNA family)